MSVLRAYQIGLELGFSVTLLIKCHILHIKKSISFTPLDATLKYHTKENKSFGLEGIAHMRLINVVVVGYNL